MRHLRTPLTTVAVSPGMELLAQVRGLVDRTSYVLTLIGGYTLLASAFLIGIDIVLRRFAAMSVRGSDELSGYALAAATAWGLAYAFFCKSHIRIDVVRRISPRSLRVWMDVISAVVLFSAAALLCYYGSRELAESIRYQSLANTPLRVPLWIPQSLWVSGLVLFAVATGLTALEAALRLWLGDRSSVERLVGMPGEDG